MAVANAPCAHRPALPRTRQHGRAWWIGALALFACPSALSAQTDDMMEARPGPVSAAQGQEEERSAGDKKKKKVDLLIAPVPLSNPATGTGLAVGVIGFYNPNHEPQQWISGAGIIYTTRGTKGIAAFQSMSFGQDRLRISASTSYMDERSDYYGIGEAAGDRGAKIGLDSKLFNLDLQALIRIFPNGYAGGRYRLRTTDSRSRDMASVPPAPLEDQQHSTLSALGPAFVYDTRDSATQPHRGVHVNANWLFGMRALGDSYSHDKLLVAGNAYLPFGSGTVIAVRGSLCAAGGDAPYYDLCLFGTANDLRGYTTGRYRDGASWAMQAEWRQHVAGRWGAVAFAGLGGIAPSVGSIMGQGNLLPAGGVGVRYQPFRSNDVQLRVDLATGKNDHAVYVGIAEAF